MTQSSFTAGSVLTLSNVELNEDIPQYRPPKRVSKTKGQHGFNPCYCCKYLCDGTCSLKTGCQFVGAAYIIAGVAGMIAWSYISFRWIYQIEENETQIKDEVVGYSVVIAHLRRSTLATVFVFIGASLFGIVPGIILFTGATILNRFVCLGYAGTAVASIMWTIGAGVVVDSVAFEPFTPEGKVAESAGSFVSLTWACCVLSILIQVYFIICGLALYKQIRDGEYKERDSDSRVAPIGYMYAVVRANMVKNVMELAEEDEEENHDPLPEIASIGSGPKVFSSGSLTSSSGT